MTKSDWWKASFFELLKIGHSDVCFESSSKEYPQQQTQHSFRNYSTSPPPKYNYNLYILSKPQPSSSFKTKQKRFKTPEISSMFALCRRSLKTFGFRSWPPKKRRRKFSIGFHGTHGTILEPQTTIFYWMFVETTISYVKIWNHPIETTIYKWMFGVPGWYIYLLWMVDCYVIKV